MDVAFSPDSNRFAAMLNIVLSKYGNYEGTAPPSLRIYDARAMGGTAILVDTTIRECKSRHVSPFGVDSSEIRGDGESGQGGALFVGDRSNAELERVHVEECSAEVGGALYAEYGTFSIDGSNIVDSCDGELGAAVHYDVASPYIIHGVGRMAKISATSFSWRNGGYCYAGEEVLNGSVQRPWRSVMVDAKASIDWVCYPGQFAPRLGDFDGRLLEDGAYGFTGCPSECLAGTYGIRTTDQTTPDCDSPCDEGHYCPAGTSTPKPCPLGTHMPTQGGRTSHCACRVGRGPRATARPTTDVLRSVRRRILRGGPQQQVLLAVS